MDISKFIYDYLMEYNTPVVVPDLGCFTIVNIPSEIRDGKVIPPFKTVKLDSENTYDNGVLTSYIARKENITIEQAAENIRKFYHQNFISRLPVTKVIVFEKFGTFSLNEYHNIVFEPDPEFFNENYGLDYAFFSDKTYQQPQERFVAPEPPVFTPPPPVYTPEPPVYTPEPPVYTPEPPVFTPEPEPVVVPEPEPVFASIPSQPNPKPEDSLFDTNDSSRFRENTTRKRPALFDQKEPSGQPGPKAKTPKAPKKPKQKTKTSNSNLWVLWVLIGAIGLGVAGYYLYPKYYPILFSPNTTITIADMDLEPIDADEPDLETPNAELAQTLDEATDKKSALKPEGSQPTEASTAKSPPQSQSTPAVAPSTTSTTVQRPASQLQTTAGQGRYILIVGSFKARSEAERFGRKLPEGISFEIVAATVNGAQWHRVSIGSFDTMAEATRQADQMRSLPNCQDVWVAKR